MGTKLCCSESKSESFTSLQIENRIIVQTKFQEIVFGMTLGNLLNEDSEIIVLVTTPNLDATHDITQKALIRGGAILQRDIQNLKTYQKLRKGQVVVLPKGANGKLMQSQLFLAILPPENEINEQVNHSDLMKDSFLWLNTHPTGNFNMSSSQRLNFCEQYVYECVTNSLKQAEQHKFYSISFPILDYTKERNQQTDSTTATTMILAIKEYLQETISKNQYLKKIQICMEVLLNINSKKRAERVLWFSNGHFEKSFLNKASQNLRHSKKVSITIKPQVAARHRVISYKIMSLISRMIFENLENLMQTNMWLASRRKLNSPEKKIHYDSDNEYNCNKFTKIINVNEIIKFKQKIKFENLKKNRPQMSVPFLQCLTNQKQFTIKQKSLSLLLIVFTIVTSKRTKLKKPLYDFLMVLRIRKIVSDSYKEAQRIINYDLPKYFSASLYIKQLKHAIKNKQRNERHNLVAQIRNEIMMETVFVLVLQPLLQQSCIIRDTIKEKYINKIRNQFSPLRNPRMIAENILNDLFETIMINGAKNLANFIRIKIRDELLRTDSFQLINNENLLDLFQSSADLTRPSDNQRLSEIQFKHLGKPSITEVFRQSQSTDRIFQTTMLFTDFTDILTHNEPSGKIKTFKEIYQNLFLENSSIIVQKHKLDVTVIWLGDIDQNKIFQDNDYFPRSIEGDLYCREEKYKPTLQKISEQLDEEEDKYGFEECRQYLKSNQPSIDDHCDQGHQVNINEIQEYDNALMQQSKGQFSEYLRKMCINTIDLLGSTNASIILHYQLKHNFKSLTERIQTSQNQTHSLIKIVLERVYKITNQLLMDINFPLTQTEAFNRCLKNCYNFLHLDFTSKINHIKLNKQVKEVDRYILIERAKVEFINLVLNFQETTQQKFLK